MKDMQPTQVRRQERYGIKKLSVGVASVLVATTLYFLPGGAQVLAASQANEEASSSQLAPAPSSDAGDQATPAPANQASAGQTDSGKPADQDTSAGQAD
ncbi:MAG: YSIRK-type signal peptide-containing protein, partial [Abiotrophia defectiva]|nr:YSIRK-type signal peptide-containing protein [Abiotrophia defectiva]